MFLSASWIVDSVYGKNEDGRVDPSDSLASTFDTSVTDQKAATVIGLGGGACLVNIPRRPAACTYTRERKRPFSAEGGEPDD